MRDLLDAVVLRVSKWLHGLPLYSRFFAASAFALLMIAGTDLWARAGGGGNYSGGGSSGDGGGGGGGDAIIWLVYLAFRYPQVGVPLLIIVAVGFVIKNRMNPDNTTARAIRSLSEMSTGGNTDLTTIRQRDPAFAETGFIDWVKKIDNEIQAAWSTGDMTPVRNYLSDGLFRRFSTQLSVMKHQNIQNPMADHHILSVKIHAVEQDSHFDTIHVAIEAQARDIEVAATLSYEEAMAQAAQAPVEKYSEIWSFLRKPGAKTLDDRGFNQGNCPSCGAPLENAQSTRCEYCNALVNSGDYDWVLAEITQPIEWRRQSAGGVAGMNRLQEKDPAFNRQVAEDRASYVFWRWIEATVLGKKEPLAKCATPEMQQKVADESPLTHFKTAVGSVDLVQVEAGPEGERDRFYVKILWSSAAGPTTSPIHRNHVFVFGREKAPEQNGGLSHAHCPNCLGPLAENDSDACEYCGTSLASGKMEWVLERVLLPYEFTFRGEVRTSAASQSAGADDDMAPPQWALPDMASRQERALLLMNMAAVVMADGVVTKQERKLLRTASRRWDVPMEMVNPILYGQVSPESVRELHPANPSAFVDGLIGAALIDGKIDSKELALLLDVSKHLGLEEATVRNRMNTLARMSKVAQVG